MPASSRREAVRQARFTGGGAETRRTRTIRVRLALESRGLEWLLALLQPARTRITANAIPRRFIDARPTQVVRALLPRWSQPCGIDGRAGERESRRPWRSLVCRNAAAGLETIERIRTRARRRCPTGSSQLREPQRHLPRQEGFELASRDPPLARPRSGSPL